MDLIGGGVDSQGSYISKILYVKTKELGPLGGAHAGRAPLDPPMHFIFSCQLPNELRSPWTYFYDLVSPSTNVPQKYVLLTITFPET